MIHAAPVSEPEVASAAPATSSVWHGYCAGCGTWDAHGFACTSCGYDFTPEGNNADPVD